MDSVNAEFIKRLESAELTSVQRNAIQGLIDEYKRVPDSRVMNSLLKNVSIYRINVCKKSIQLESEYLCTHANLVAMIENLREFAQSMPAPNDDNEIPACVNWAVLGDYKRIEAALIEVCKVADEIGK